MADLHLHRDHALGLARARQVALKWAEELERKLDMACTFIEGGERDVLEFRRAGVDGRMTIAATGFDLEASLGFLFKPFAAQIEAEVGKQLDETLAKESVSAKPARKR